MDTKGVNPLTDLLEARDQFVHTTCMYIAPSIYIPSGTNPEGIDEDNLVSDSEGEIIEPSVNDPDERGA
jgi:hypothetical protein